MEQALAIAIISLLTQAVIVLGVHLKNVSQDHELKVMQNSMAELKGHHDNCEREVKRLREIMQSEGHKT